MFFELFKCHTICHYSALATLVLKPKQKTSNTTFTQDQFLDYQLKVSLMMPSLNALPSPWLSSQSDSTHMQEGQWEKEQSSIDSRSYTLVSPNFCLQKHQVYTGLRNRSICQMRQMHRYLVIFSSHVLMGNSILQCTCKQHRI